MTAIIPLGKKYVPFNERLYGSEVISEMNLLGANNVQAGGADK